MGLSINPCCVHSSNSTNRCVFTSSVRPRSQIQYPIVCSISNLEYVSAQWPLACSLSLSPPHPPSKVLIFFEQFSHLLPIPHCFYTPTHHFANKPMYQTKKIQQLVFALNFFEFWPQRWHFWVVPAHGIMHFSSTTPNCIILSTWIQSTALFGVVTHHWWASVLWGEDLS